VVAGQQRGAAELLKVATGTGFAFTAAELMAALQEQMKQQHAAGALKDEDLLQVAGSTQVAFIYTWVTYSLNAGLNACGG